MARTLTREPLQRIGIRKEGEFAEVAALKLDGSWDLHRTVPVKKLAEIGGRLREMMAEAAASSNMLVHLSLAPTKFGNFDLYSSNSKILNEERFTKALATISAKHGFITGAEVKILGSDEFVDRKSGIIIHLHPMKAEFR
jgi:hypothetical protein